MTPEIETTHPLPASDRVGLNPNEGVVSVSHDNQWNEKVARGRALVTEISDRKWELGDLANEVCPATDNGVHNDDELGQFADDIGIARTTLKQYRYVASRWAAVTRVTGQTWTTHRMLAERDDRLAIIAEQTWTYNSLSDRLGRLPNPSRVAESATIAPLSSAEIPARVATADAETKRRIFVELSNSPDVSDDKETRRAAEKNLDAAFERSDWGKKSTQAQKARDARDAEPSDGFAGFVGWVEMSTKLSKARREIKVAMEIFRGTKIDGEKLDLIRDEVEQVKDVVLLLDMLVNGTTQDVDWNAELAKMAGDF